MIGVCSKCSTMFETTTEDAYTPGVLCPTCYRAAHPKTFRITVDGGKHLVADESCPNCWTKEFPKRCECGGLIHQDFGDESFDGEYFCRYACDNCGFDYGLAEQSQEVGE